MIAGSILEITLHLIYSNIETFVEFTLNTTYLGSIYIGNSVHLSTRLSTQTEGEAAGGAGQGGQGGGGSEGGRGGGGRPPVQQESCTTMGTRILFLKS